MTRKNAPRGGDEAMALSWTVPGRVLAAALLVVLGAGCGGLVDGDEETPAPPEEPEEEVDEEEPEEEEPENLRHVAVTASDPGGSLQQGDSVAVVFERTPPVGHEGKLFQPDAEEEAALPASDLGPLPGSTGWVTATTLNLRACPSPDCDSVGTVRLGHELEIHEMEDGWYRVDPEENRWASAEHVALLEGWAEVVADLVWSQVEGFAEEYLEGRLPEGADEDAEPLFSDWHLGLKDGQTLAMTLSANYNQGPAGQEVCQWAYSATEVLEDVVAQVGGYGIQEYDVVVYYRGREAEPVAQLTDDGEVTCILR